MQIIFIEVKVACHFFAKSFSLKAICSSCFLAICKMYFPSWQWYAGFWFWLYRLLAITESLPGGGGVPAPLFPEIVWLVPLFPKNRKFVSIFSLFPKIVFVPLKIWPLFPCSPEINAVFHCSLNSPGGPYCVSFTELNKMPSLLSCYFYSSESTSP